MSLCKGSCDRLLSIWQERGVYDGVYIQAIKQTKENGEGAKGQDMVPILKSFRTLRVKSEQVSVEDEKKTHTKRHKSKTVQRDEEEGTKEKKRKKNKSPLSSATENKSSSTATEFPLDILKKDLEQTGKPEDVFESPEPVDLIKGELHDKAEVIL